MKYAFIREQHSSFRVRKMCQALKVTPSGYYFWLRGEKSQRKKEDERLLVEIQDDKFEPYFAGGTEFTVKWLIRYCAESGMGF